MLCVYLGLSNTNKLSYRKLSKTIRLVPIVFCIYKSCFSTCVDNQTKGVHRGHRQTLGASAALSKAQDRRGQWGLHALGPRAVRGGTVGAHARGGSGPGKRGSGREHADERDFSRRHV